MKDSSDTKTKDLLSRSRGRPVKYSSDEDRKAARAKAAKERRSRERQSGVDEVRVKIPSTFNQDHPSFFKGSLFSSLSSSDESYPSQEDLSSIVFQSLFSIKGASARMHLSGLLSSDDLDAVSECLDRIDSILFS